mgnify:CR=1 FL=1
MVPWPLIALGSIYVLMPHTTEGRGVKALVFGGVTVQPLVMLNSLSGLHSETLLNVIVLALWLLSTGLPRSYFCDASTQRQGFTTPHRPIDVVFASSCDRRVHDHRRRCLV